MKIEYVNMANGSSRFSFRVKYFFNLVRTWLLFTFKYPWVKYNGFVRVMPYVEFVKFKITIGHNVQFGKGSLIASDVQFGNNILIAANVSFVGRLDHDYRIPGTPMWYAPRAAEEPTIVEDDVWIGNNATVLAGVKISKGAIVAAGALVTKDIPACEIWGGVPAKKIKDRFENNADKEFHLKVITK